MSPYSRASRVYATPHLAQEGGLAIEANLTAGPGPGLHHSRPGRRRGGPTPPRLSRCPRVPAAPAIDSELNSEARLTRSLPEGVQRFSGEADLEELRRNKAEVSLSQGSMAMSSCALNLEDPTSMFCKIAFKACFAFALTCFLAASAASCLARTPTSLLSLLHSHSRRLRRYPQCHRTGS